MVLPCHQQGAGVVPSERYSTQENTKPLLLDIVVGLGVRCQACEISLSLHTDGPASLH